MSDLSVLPASFPNLPLRAVSVVLHYWRAGGWLMVPLALITFAIWHRYLVLWTMLRRSLKNADGSLGPGVSVSGVSVPAGEGPSGPPEGALPRIGWHLQRRMAAGLPFREAFEQCRLEELAPYRYAFYTLGALVAVAPLLGLLGTVFGMVDTFRAVSMRSGETSTMVADGISQALITTQVGLVAALPGTFGLAHLHRLYVRLRHAIDRSESQLSLRIEHGPDGGGTGV